MNDEQNKTKHSCHCRRFVHACTSISSIYIGLHSVGESRCSWVSVAQGPQDNFALACRISVTFVRFPGEREAEIEASGELSAIHAQFRPDGRGPPRRARLAPYARLALCARLGTILKNAKRYRESITPVMQANIAQTILLTCDQSCPHPIFSL